MGKLSPWHIILSILIATYVMLSPLTTGATEEYARQTGKSCAICHIDPSGGGELSPPGRQFAESLSAQSAKPTSIIILSKGFHFLVGYLHILTAFLWFGTILYVHLVLKPAYASSGLPRGEKRVGIISMIVMGVTGVILTKFRFDSPEVLLQSRFGILLLVKIGLYLIMVSTAAFVVIVIGPRMRQKRSSGTSLVKIGDMVDDELALCDGKEGRPAFFAYNGTIYDASESHFWKQGSHMGRHQAGSDLTEILAQAPHDSELIARLPTVGRLVAGGKRVAPLHERVFYFIAYMNLIIVFLIILILALWRWW
ncbi:MAG: cytochrome b5 domain-containing protein [Desulfuromonadaceae bacterium]|nr:cytochrome b5 domain-containing protein [Desulfuromonadaceae bacterium]MDD5104382.1 cytochrome b5 domain-containing protein [Desulfuromonadaceae bacterium]